MALSSIGGPAAFTFIKMTQPPMGFSYEGFVESRPGVEGHAIWRDAPRGVTWESETFVTMPNALAAWQLAALHEEFAPFAGPLRLIWNGREFDYHVVVLRVRSLEVREMVAQVGGIGTGTLRSQWTLMSVKKVKGNKGLITFKR